MAKEGAHPRNKGARVYNSADISIPDSTVTLLTFNAQRFDTDNIHSLVSNTSRLTCRTAGKYIIIGMCRFADNETGYRVFYIYLNGTTPIGYTRTTYDAAGRISMPVVSIYDLAKDDYVEFFVYQSSTAPLNVSAVSNYSPEFMMQRLV